MEIRYEFLQMLKRNWPSTENVPVDILYEIGELQEKEQLENIKFFEDNEQILKKPAKPQGSYY